MLNEHIVATTILCLSRSNVLPYSIQFEVEARLDDSEIHYEGGNLNELAALFELSSGQRLGSEYGNRTARQLQYLGRVDLPEGRLLAMPSVLRRFSDSKPQLADPSKPGHMRLLVLHLVDPNYRICSTRNVPPQQHAWWWAGAAGPERLVRPTKGGVPEEIDRQIAEETGYWPLSHEEAVKLREQREVEEDVYWKAVEFGVGRYSFQWE